MGCDIHIVLERRKKSQPAEWIGVWASDEFPGGRPPIASRNYYFFAHVANVRGSGPNYPRNVPEDISDLAWQQYMEAPRDHHSASHMALGEFTASWITATPEGLRGKVREECAVYDLLGVSGDDDYEHRVVFWFDN